MSSRPQLASYPVILNGDMSASITSKVTIIQKLSLISYSLSWTGSTPVGVLYVEVSNDFSENSDGSVRNAGTWNAIPLSNPTNVSGNTGNGFIEVVFSSAYAIRIRYVRTSGTGTLQAVINAKVS